MNLYLSSFRIGDSGAQLTKLADGRTALIVSNALDFSEDIERLKSSREREAASLSELGIRSEYLDLRDYFDGTNDLQNRIKDAGMLWVVGGNTFLLRKAMMLSRFDQILQDIGDSEFVYGGYSAGVCVLSSSLRGIHLADKPNSRSVGYEHNTIWDGLSVLDYYIVPHYRCDHPESESMEAVVEYYRQHKQPYKTLSDGEVIIETNKNG